jgi:type 1 fimbriae regulatory protein FimB
MDLDPSKLSATELRQLRELLTKAGAAVADAPERPRKRRPADQVKYLTESELEELFRVIRSPRDYAIFRIAYHRGLRASEIGCLDLADYRQKEERLNLRRLKGSRAGEFHLCRAEVKALRAWLRIRGSAPGPLFPSRRGTCRAKGISQQMLDVLIKKYGAEAGIPEDKRHMHVLKHSCGTHLLNRGERIEDVQDHLGHVNIQNTMIYARITNKRRQETDERLRDW